MGFVYFIRETGTQFFKIGATSDSIETRTVQLQVGNPRELKVFGFVECEEPMEKEKEIHNIWFDRHIRGDWFSFTDAQAFDIIKAHEGQCCVDNTAKSDLLPPESFERVAEDTDRESIILLAYERAIKVKSEPSIRDIEKLTEKLGNRVPVTAVWNILNSLRSKGRLPLATS